MRNIIYLLSFVVFMDGCAKQPPAKETVSETPNRLGMAERGSESGDIRYPSISVDNGTAKSRVTYRFRFESEQLKISLKVDEAVYQGARDAEKVALVPPEMRDADLSVGFQRALIKDPAQKPFYETLLGELRSIRDRLRLDDDRYQELLITFVQQIEYCDEHADNPKFPIETFVEKCGDCDDKSRLLAGLLEREGFEVVLLLFSEEAHMAVGLKSPPLDYRGTGYSYVETTSPALVGFLTDENTSVKIRSTPEVVPIGTGKPYGRGKEVAYLKETFAEMKACVADTKPKVAARSEACREGEAELAGLKTTLDRTPKSDPGRRQDAVDNYNRAVDKYNRLVAKRNAVAAELNACAEIFNYILKNAHDRSGVYRWVRDQRGR